jgi:hypothetical protein
MKLNRLKIFILIIEIFVLVINTQYQNKSQIQFKRGKFKQLNIY